MSCGPLARTFRLLDGHVGWNAASVTQIDDADREAGALQLALVSPGAIDPSVLDGLIPPRRLARGCGPCEWLLAADGGVVLRRGGDRWFPVDSALGRPATPPRTLIAIAARGHWIAASDGHDVYTAARAGDQVFAAAPIANASALAIAPWDELLVAVPGAILRRDLAGVARGQIAAPPPADPIDRMAIGSDCALWIVTRGSDATLHLWRAGRSDTAFTATTIEALAAACSPTGITVSGPAGFCIAALRSGRIVHPRCFHWDGEPAADIAPAGPPARAGHGELVTSSLDSGVARTRWHRVRVDADVPIRTKVEVSVAAMEDDTPPHPADWQPASTELDFLIQQPPGRYLFVRIALTGDGSSTPTVRRVRLDLPRSTSLEHLPAVFRETPEAEDFTERFLSLFDATIEQIDQAIARLPALLDAGGVPDEVLPWLASLLDIAFDPSWTTDQRRRLLEAAPALYRRRGTRRGLVDTIETITGVAPAIRELALERRFGAVGRDTRIGSVRLFSRSAARFRIGSSKLGAAPVESFGNPDQDPLTATAFRFQVLAPPQAVGSSPQARERLEQLVLGQRPAHTIASLRIGGGGYVLGVQSVVGIDTVLGGLPPPVLGKTIRLGRMSALWPSTKGCRVGFTAGHAALGRDTAMRMQ